MNEHLNKDSLAAAFKQVMEELDKANQEITKQITQASTNADYEKVQVLVDRGKSLKDFQSPCERPAPRMDQRHRHLREFFK